MERELITERFVFQQYCFREPRRNDVGNGNGCHFVGFLRRGEGVMTGEGVEVHVRAGELFYIPRDYPYVSVWSGTPDVCFDSYGFSHFPIPTEGAYPLQRVETDAGILSALDALASHRTVDLRSVGNLYLLLDRMLPHMTVGATDAAYRTVESALAYLQASSSLSVPALARHCRVSESGLYSAFRRVKGYTPVEAWHRILAARAEELLTGTDLSVEEISERLGFCSASYFRKILRRVTGMTPREVRRGARI